MKNYILLCSILLISINFQNIKSESIDSIDDLPEIAPITESTSSDSTTTTPCPTIAAEDILSFITPACNSEESDPIVNIIPLLSKNIYKKTAGPVLRRSLLDEPSLQPYLFGDICSWNVTAQPFYNVTPKVKFSKTSHLDNYLNINNKGFFKEINTIVKDIENLTGETSTFSFQGALCLIKPVKLQQHRAGVMFDFNRTWNCFYVSYRIPLYYLVEHFHLNDKEIEKIKKSEFFTSSEPAITDFGTEEDGDRFLRRHFMTDTVGLGDSRITLLMAPYQNERFKLWTGAQFTAPTAKKIRSNMLGEEIDFCAPTPTIDIQNLASLALCSSSEAAKREANKILINDLSDFGIQFINRLSTILINTPLGNGKHWGVGPQIDFTYQFNNCWSTHGTAIFEWLATHRERRFFIKVPSKSVLNQCFRDTENPDEKLNLIGELAVNTLFPAPITVGVRPGYLIKVRQLVSFDTNLWNASLGVDYWRQAREKFVHFEFHDKQKYAIKKAEHDSADQLKLYGSLGYHEEIPNCNMSWFGLFAWDAAVWSRNLGNNFTASAQFGINF